MSPASEPPTRLAPHEHWRARWLRRAISVPTTLLVGALAAALAPLALPLLFAIDLARPRRLALTRAALLLLTFVWMEILAIVGAFVLWLGSGVWAGGSRERFMAGNAWLQERWGHALFSIGRRLYRVRVTVEGEAPRPGRAPLLVFARHASTIDTLLPVVLLSYPFGWRLRYVLKHELLADPSLDIVGNRLPNVFVRRSAGRTAEETERVIALAERLGPSDAVVIFPEGTRFTPARRAQTIARLSAHGPSAALTLSRELRQTLSPLRAGPLGLLAQNQGADLLLIAHVGLEPIGTLAALGNGALVGLHLRVRLTRVRFADLPTVPEQQAELLATLWREVDRFAEGDGIT